MKEQKLVYGERYRTSIYDDRDGVYLGFVEDGGRIIHTIGFREQSFPVLYTFDEYSFSETKLQIHFLESIFPEGEERAIIAGLLEKNLDLSVQ